jgi:beta-galactosidase
MISWTARFWRCLNCRHGQGFQPCRCSSYAEGASPLRIGDYWYIYFDKYRNKRYGAIRSKDLKGWEDITDEIELPPGARHGTAFRVSREIVKRLDEMPQR